MFRGKLRSGRPMLGPAIGFSDPLVSEARADSPDQGVRWVQTATVDQAVAAAQTGRG